MNSAQTIFIRKLAAFLLLPVIAMALVIPLLDQVAKYKLKAFRLKEGTDLLLAGDSHVSTSLDDKLIPRSTNIASPGEPYRFTYHKLKVVLAGNPGVKTVVLGFSYHNLSTYLDSNITGKKGGPITAEYFFMLPHEDQWMLLRNFAKDLAPYLQTSLQHGVSNLFKSPPSQGFIGKFENLYADTRALDSSMEKRIRYQYYPEGRLARFSEQNMAWLDSIAMLCHDRNINLMYLNTPMNAKYRNGIPREYMQFFEEKLRHDRIPVIDFSAMPLRDDHFMPDGDHLSVQGARELSLALGKLLK